MDPKEVTGALVKCPLRQDGCNSKHHCSIDWCIKGSVREKRGHASVSSF